MKKLTLILLSLFFLSACSDSLVANVEDNEVDVPKLENDDFFYDITDDTIEQPNVTPDIPEIPEVPKRSEETVNINDFTEDEIIELRQRFFTLDLEIEVNSTVNDEIISALKTISLDEHLDEGEINIDDLEAFFMLTDENFTDTTYDFLMLTNKVYSLPYNYVPEELRVPSVNSAYTIHLETTTATALEAMFSQSKIDGVNLVLTSGYRDFEWQNRLFQRKAESVGYENANKVVAKPGESEHQTGFVVDITCDAVSYMLVENFQNTAEFAWLDANAADFGFIMRYAPDKVDITGYSYEPWHYRYVGDPEIANFIKNNNLTLEEYHELYLS
ncbi:MAG: M15 family metallopeptidase [Clostridia bacterium]